MATKASEPEVDLELDFNPGLFNNIYWHIKAAFNNVLIRFIWLYGGSSASKTYSVVQLQIVKMLEGKDENALVLRKYATDIKDSIYADFESIIKEWGLEQYFKIQINYIECTLTGSYVRFRGLDDSEKVKGISQFKRIILEEVSQFDEADLKQIRKRLRGKLGQQIIGIFNPISEDHWIKIHIFDPEHIGEDGFGTERNSDIYCGDAGANIPISGMWVNQQGNLIVFKNNYIDNVYIVGRWADGVQIGGFVDLHTIDDFEKDKLEDNNYYQIYALGNWGKIRTGGEFWKEFKYERHVTDTIGYNAAMPIHQGWDENVNPYLPCEVWQLYDVDNMLVHNGISLKGKKVAVQIDEIFLTDPLNRRHHVCTEFGRRYPVAVVQGLFIYGDRTSLKEDTAKEKGENFFTDVQKLQTAYHPSLRLQDVNPSVVKSKEFVDKCYAGHTEIVILIHARCKKSIADYQYALEDELGNLKKTLKKNPITKVSFQEYGHASDIKRYVITRAYAAEYAQYLAGGKGRPVKVGKAISKNNY